MTKIKKPYKICCPHCLKSFNKLIDLDIDVNANIVELAECDHEWVTTSEYHNGFEEECVKCSRFRLHSRPSDSPEYEIVAINGRRIE